MHEPKPLGGKIFTKPFQILLIFGVIGVFLILKRYFFGLGSVSNLNDGYPWGMWIVYDVVTGTAIACGGYSMALLVYVFNKGEYHPLVRSALMAGMFGYTLAGVSIYVDTGRWWNLQNIFIPPTANPNSIMFEVAVCVALYVAVMWIEFSPSFLENQKEQKGKLKIINKVMFVFISIGVLLPTMHQSSLGSLMIIGGHKLHSLWQTNLLPLMFLLTAITMGYAIVIFESLFASLGLKRPLETSLLSKLAAIIPKLIIAFFVVRIADLIYRGALGEIFRFNLQSIMFIIENLLFIYPMVVLLSAKKRQAPKYLFLSAVSMLVAGALYRFDAFLIAFNPGNGYHYFPAFSEIMITVGIIAIEIMAYLWFVKRLPVLPDLKHAQ
jgi:Ni/Fe-hydrogenase subunit HybB-like protein